MKKKGTERERFVVMTAAAAAGLLLLSLTLAAAGPGQELAERLGLDKALAGGLKASECRKSFQGLTIKLLQGSDGASSTCYAWGGIFQGKALLSEIRPTPIAIQKGVGGLVLPSQQPWPTVFLVQQRDPSGDRIAVVRKDGSVVSLPGRDAVVFREGSILGTFTPGREGALALFDLASGQEIYRSEKTEPGIFAWYARGGALVGSVVTPSAQGFGESPHFYYIADPARGLFKLEDKPLPDTRTMQRLDLVPFASVQPCRCGS